MDPVTQYQVTNLPQSRKLDNVNRSKWSILEPLQAAWAIKWSQLIEALTLLLFGASGLNGCADFR